LTFLLGEFELYFSASFGVNHFSDFAVCFDLLDFDLSED
jgi:hypothetical protein